MWKIVSKIPIKRKLKKFFCRFYKI